MKIAKPLDALQCWDSSEKLINMCKTFLTTVQEYTLQQTGANNLKTEDNVLAAQVAVDASFNECQNILNVNAAMKLALQNSDGSANLLPAQTL